LPTEPPQQLSLPEQTAPPWWVTVLDVLTAAAAAVVISNIFFGGFRIRVGEDHITATSVVRDGIALALVLGLRMFLYRKQPLWQRIADWARHAWQSRTRTAVLVPWFSSRVMVLAIGYFAVVMFGYPGTGGPPVRISRNEFVNLPMKWDAGWYLGIVLDGYDFNPRIADRQQNVAFFPAYPMLTRLGAALIGSRSISAAEATGINRTEYAYAQHHRIVLAAMLISLGAFLWALVYLYRFAGELMDEQAALGAVLVASFYPFSLFFSAFYTESLFLLTLLGSFYHMRRREWLPASAWGLLLGLTRPNGCLMSIPLALLVLQQAWNASRASGKAIDRREVIAGILASSMPGIGMLIFSAYLYTLAGRPFVWLEAHGAWGRVYEGLDTLFLTHLSIMANQGLYGYSMGMPTEFINGLAVVGALLAVWPITRRVGVVYGVFMLIMLLPPLMRGGFLSMGRVTSTMFPLYLYLGWRLRGTTRDTILMASAGLQGFFASLFFTWRPLF
jgi:Mannosyltransferase (PIG-V)